MFPDKPASTIRIRCIIWHCYNCEVCFVKVFADNKQGDTTKLWESEPMRPNDQRVIDIWKAADEFYGS